MLRGRCVHFVLLLQLPVASLQYLIPYYSCSNDHPIISSTILIPIYMYLVFIPNPFLPRTSLYIVFSVSKIEVGRRVRLDSSVVWLKPDLIMEIDFIGEIGRDGEDL